MGLSSFKKKGFLFLTLALLFSGQVLAFASESDIQEVDNLLAQCYEYLIMLENVGGNTDGFISEINIVIDSLDDVRGSSSIGGLEDRIISNSHDRIGELLDEIQNELIEERGISIAARNNRILYGSFTLVGLIVVGIFLIVNPPGFLIGLNWFGEFDES